MEKFGWFDLSHGSTEKDLTEEEARKQAEACVRRNGSHGKAVVFKYVATYTAKMPVEVTEET